MQIDEEVFREFKSYGNEVVEGIENFVVELFSEGLDLLLLLFQELGKRLGDVAVRSLIVGVSIERFNSESRNHVLAMFQTSVLSLILPLRSLRPAGRYPL